MPLPDLDLRLVVPPISVYAGHVARVAMVRLVMSTIGNLVTPPVCNLQGAVAARPRGSSLPRVRPLSGAQNVRGTLRQRAEEIAGGRRYEPLRPQGCIGHLAALVAGLNWSAGDSIGGSEACAAQRTV